MHIDSTNLRTSRFGLIDIIGIGPIKGDLFKLLGAPFGLNLKTKDVDEFLYCKVSKKLDYWSSMLLSLAGRVVICNQVFLSTL